MIYIDHLYALLDHCTYEDILQQIKKNMKVALNVVKVNNRNII